MSKVALRVYNREIETLVDQGHLEEAIAHCQHILKLYPKHLETYRLLGKAYLEAHRHADALDIFQRVLLSVPDDFVSQLGMSIVRDEQKDLDSAIWHMERAYEVNPSNVAVQGELRSLYGRRDGLEPPKIRLTRGALAHMYTKGGQYQQAITEIKSVLAEDATRLDMRVLMARALYRGGQKVEATEICIDLLNQAAFCLDANRILIEVLPGTSMAQNVDTYKKRVQALEPYALHVTGSIFDIDGVPDNAITLDRLDWDPDTDTASNTFSGSSNSQPSQSAQNLPDFLTGTGWGPSTGEFQDGPMDFSAEDEPAVASSGLAAAEIPDWLKAMAPPGASSAADNQDAPATDQNLEAEDLDWLSGLGGPVSAAKSPAPAAAASNDQPDWLSDLGGSASMDLPGAESSTAAPEFSDDQPDWMKDLGMATATGAAASAADDSTDWLQKLHEPATQPEAAPSEDMDWLAGLGLPQESAPASNSSVSEPSAPAEPAATEDMDWLAGLGLPQESAPVSTAPAQPAAAADEDMDWLAGLGLATDAAPAAAPVEKTPAPTAAVETPPVVFPASLDQPTIPQKRAMAQDDPNFVPPPLSELVSGPGTSEAEQDDAMKWLESLAANQGAKAEELLTHPSERTDAAPTWAAQANTPTIPAAQTPPPAPQPIEAKKKMAQDDPNFVPPPLSELVSGPGTSEAEQDDAMKWLESLAANQGAKAEELLTHPSERTDAAPTWAAQANTPTIPAAQTPPPAPQPTEAKKKMAQDDPNFVPPPLSELVSGPGTSEAEQDDAMKWLESLAANQGAKAEELLTHPSERTDAVPAWAAQNEKPTTPPVVPAVPVAQTPPPAPQPIEVKKKMAQDDPNFVPPPLSELVSGPGTSEAEQDDAMKWLESLAANQGAKAEELLTHPSERTDAVPSWAAPAPADAPTTSPVVPAAPVAQTPPPAPQQPVEVKKKMAQDDPNFVPPPLSELVSGPGTSEAEQDDAMKWLESLAANQGAKAEELLTHPSERTDAVPSWAAPVAQTPPPAPQQPVEVKKKMAQDDPNFVPPPLSELVSGPGTSEAEQDDAMKWLESLAANQGAKAEELLTHPSERTDAVPSWAAQADAMVTPPAESQPTIIQKKIAQDDPNFVPPPLSELISGPGTSEAEQDDAMKWLESLAANQGAKAEELLTHPSERTDAVPDWAAQTIVQPAAPADLGPSSSEQDDAMRWLESLAETQSAQAEMPVAQLDEPNNDIPDWAAETLPVDVTAPSVPEPTAQADDAMAWLQDTVGNDRDANQAPVEDVVSSQLDFSAPAAKMPWEEEVSSEHIEEMPWESQSQASPIVQNIPEAAPEPTTNISEWLSNLDVESNAETSASVPVAKAADEMPDWLNNEQQSAAPDSDLPDWLKDKPADKQSAVPARFQAWLSDSQDETSHLIFSPPLETPPTPPPAPVPDPIRVPTTPLTPPVQPPAPIRPAVRQTGMLGDKDGPILQNARHQMAHGGIDVAISGYVKLIKRAKFLEEVIYDLKEATYTYPVDVGVWQTLGDAHMRANQLQDALDAYTKAEELLR